MWSYRDASSTLAPIRKLPEFQIYELAWMFAPAEQVRSLIRTEPMERHLPTAHLTPGSAAWKNMEIKYNTMKLVRLAIVAPNAESRKKLLDEALCDPCNREALEKMYGLFAQDHLVPPGDDVDCRSCEDRREPLPSPPK